MSVIKKCLVILFILAYIELNQCKRYGGGSRSPSRGSFTTPRRITTPRSYSHTTPRSYGVSSPRHTTPRGGGFTTPRQYPPRGGGITTPRNSAPNAGWNIPPKPGAPGSYHEPSKVTIKNKYYYNYPGYVGAPQPSHYPGYFQPSTQYHYSSSDTGSTALGFFLGYGLAKLTTPTFTHQSFYDGYVPRYDHYTVHHYYHDKDAVPKQQEIKANSIVGCVGDTTTVCPGNTTTLCTSDGVLMCVVSATSTVPCTDNKQVNCIKSVISCVNNTAPECKNAQNSTTINVPCVSNAKIYGDLQTVNNTIVPNNATLNATSTNSTTESTTSATVQFSTKYPITTTPTTTTTVKEEKKEPQNFCVTVIALPAKREPTKGEIAFEDAKYVLSNFFESAWGLK